MVGIQKKIATNTVATKLKKGCYNNHIGKKIASMIERTTNKEKTTVISSKAIPT